MFERLESLARNLPDPDPAETSWNEFRDQHIRRAHRLRAEAFKCLMSAAGRGLLGIGLSVAHPYDAYQQLRARLVRHDDRGLELGACQG